MSGLSIEERLAKVEGELAIRRIIFDYSAYLDKGEWGPYVDLFAPDGEWQNDDGHFKGQAAIRQMLLDTAFPGIVPERRNYHFNVNERVDVDGDRATAVSRYMFVMRGTDDCPRVALAGMYHDAFVRIGDTWKIAKRVAVEVIPTHAEWMAMMGAK